MFGKLVKINRYSESFWLREVRSIAPDVWIGTVDNELMPDNPFRRGDTVPFAEREIIDTTDFPKPKLEVVK